MKPKLILAMLVVAGAAYWGYMYFPGGSPMDDEKNIRLSFRAMTQAIVKKDRKGVNALIAPTFVDKSIKRQGLINVLTMKRTLYNAKVQSVVVQGDLASISYARNEVRGKESEPIATKITGETWARDKSNPMRWKLKKLAVNDKWFRTNKIPPKVVLGSAKKQRVLGSLEKKKSASMEVGRRYSSIGRRDPFRSLISFEMDVETGARDVCDPDRPRELLESYDLLSLKLSGVIQGGDANLALIEAPDGKGYSVRIGMYIGKRCGAVTQIENDYILVEEQIPKVGTDAVVFEPIESALKLRPEEG
ncbi:hypothetical protein MNBD_NITROSPINAE01-1688 [hydrothermal vent metagenome]|uniref:Uncharacterized protein n=1 Tax=hydrothermal vent metagenome TaxID=652676 RepID=A0A3B1BKF3_9ZZZZ